MIGIFGATGLIGRTFIDILNENRIDVDLMLFASDKSLNKTLLYHDKYCPILKMNEDNIKKIDAAFIFLPTSIIEKYLPLFEKYKIKIIDNSSLKRLDENVPLVIDEIYQNDLDEFNYISNPNCSTIQSVLPIYYINKINPVLKIKYVTFQSLSGGGKKLIHRFQENPFFENVYPYIGNMDKNYSEEEIKMINETKKILNLNIPIDALCLRSSALYVHASYVELQLEKDINIAEIKAILNQKRLLVDENIHFLKDMNYIQIMRLRKSLINNKILSFITLSDNLRVGAAYNSYLIGKRLKLF